MIFVSSTAFKEDIFESEGRALSEKFSNIELSGGNGYYPDSILVEKLDKLFQKKIKKFLIHNYFPIPHTSFVLNFASSDKTVIDKSLSLSERALNLCQRYDVPYYSFHPGYLSDGRESVDGHFRFSTHDFFSYEEAFQQFVLNIDKLYQMARNRKVCLAIENLFIAPNNLRTSLNCSFKELDELMSILPSDVGLLIDLGHLNISSNYLQFDKYEYLDDLLEKYPDRVFEIHVSANNGEFDQHYPISPDDWQLKVLEKFRICPGIDGKGINVTLEARRLDKKTLFESVRTVEKHL